MPCSPGWSSSANPTHEAPTDRGGSSHLDLVTHVHAVLDGGHVEAGRCRHEHLVGGMGGWSASIAPLTTRRSTSRSEAGRRWPGERGNRRPAPRRQTHMKIRCALVAVLMTAAACGGSTTSTTTSTTASPTVPPDAAVLRADLVGGCFMMGPNCVRYVVYGDGTVEAFRLVGQGAQLEGTAGIDPDIVAELWNEMGRTDMEALQARLGPGECFACVDGIDTKLTLTVGAESWFFDSAEVEFDRREPLFALVDAIISQASSILDIPVVQG
jgi:hypothetical protein